MVPLAVLFAARVPSEFEKMFHLMVSVVIYFIDFRLHLEN